MRLRLKKSSHSHRALAWWKRDSNSSETVLTVSAAKSRKPLETVYIDARSSITGLKPGVNETTFRAKPHNDETV